MACFSLQAEPDVMWVHVVKYSVSNIQILLRLKVMGHCNARTQKSETLHRDTLTIRESISRLDRCPLKIQ